MDQLPLTALIAALTSLTLGCFNWFNQQKLSEKNQRGHQRAEELKAYLRIEESKYGDSWKVIINASKTIQSIRDTLRTLLVSADYTERFSDINQYAIQFAEDFDQLTKIVAEIRVRKDIRYIFKHVHAVKNDTIVMQAIAINLNETPPLSSSLVTRKFEPFLKQLEDRQRQVDLFGQRYGYEITKKLASFL